MGESVYVQKWDSILSRYKSNDYKIGPLAKIEIQ